jgi:DNA-binding NtrC family response regulator
MQAQLESLVREMNRGGILYSEAVYEFKKAFIAVALRNNEGNKTKAARILGMHRNTLGRIISELKLDVRSIRGLALRRPPKAAHPVPQLQKELS